MSRRDVVRGGFGEEEGGGDRGCHAVRGAGERLQGDEVRGAVGGAQPQAAGRGGEAVDVARRFGRRRSLMRPRSRPSSPVLHLSCVERTRPL